MTSDFLEHLEEDPYLETPFVFNLGLMGEPFKLPEMKLKAIEIFENNIKRKGYKFTLKKNHTSRYCDYEIIVE